MSFEVEVTNLDSEINGFPKIHFVKIDVEGAEYNVLLGMLNLIKRDKPHIILELTDKYLKDFGSSSEALLTLMDDLSYTCYKILNHTLTPMKDLDSTLPGQFNVLFSVHDIPYITW